MVANKSLYALLIIVIVILIPTLVLVGITFSKVQDLEQTEAPIDHPTSIRTEKPPQSTTQPINPPAMTTTKNTAATTAPQTPKSTVGHETTKAKTTAKTTTTTTAKLTTPSIKVQAYSGDMNTEQPWDQNLLDPLSSTYKENVIKYNDILDNAIKVDYPDGRAEVSSFDESTVVKKFNVGGRSVFAGSTVVVRFASFIPYSPDSTPPPATAIQANINTNIGGNDCKGCQVDTLETATTTTSTVAPETTPHTTPVHDVGYAVAAEYLKRNMDESVKPCDDFYKFACGNFKKNHPTPKGVVGYGTFDLVQDRVMDHIDIQLNKANLSDPRLEDWLRKTKVFYDSCTAFKQDGLKDNKKLIRIIDSFGGWPLMMNGMNDTWDPKKFDLSEVLARLTSNFSVNTLITAGVDLDWKSPTHYLLQIDQATLGLGNREYYIDRKFRDMRDEYVEMIRETAAILSFDQGLPQDDWKVKIAAEEILEVETWLAKRTATEDERKDYTRMYNPFEITTLQTQYPFLQWKTYFDRLLPDTVQKPFSGTVNVVEAVYLDDLNKFVMKLQEKPERLANYLIWRLIFSLDMFMDRRLADRTTYKFQHIEKAQKFEVRTAGDCISMIIDNLGFSAGRLLLEGEEEKAHKNDELVLNLTATLMESFNMQLDTLFWMDETSRNISKEKLMQYVELAGFPTWIEDSKKLNDYFKDFRTIQFKDMFFDNYIFLMSFYQNSQFRVIEEKQVSRDTWTTSPAVVNAYYDPVYNSITFPSGILRPPFFNYDFPPAVNFGSLGAIIGHEITHGFDDEGIQFNGEGYLETWMTPHSRIGFKRMVECVIRQYNRTCFSQVDMCIDGVQTQGENTADNGGIREAHSSFLRYMKEHPDERDLPGLENYTMDQIFFISFANVWCGDYETADYLEQQLVTNVHSPPPARVLNTLKNYAGFGRAFECEVGQMYYPYRSEACYVWESPPISKNPAYNRSAENILSNMNKTVDPCDNFFEYACGNFLNTHHMPEGARTFLAYDLMQDRVYAEIVHGLNNLNSSSPKSEQEAQKYFKICTDSVNVTKDNKDILDVLQMLGGWPAINSSWEPPIDANKDISALVGAMSNRFNLHTLIVPSSQVDVRHATRHLLTLDQSTLALVARQYYFEPKLKVVLDAYTNLIMNVTFILAKDSNATVNPQDAFQTASSIVDFEKGIAARLYNNTARRNYFELYHIYNMTELDFHFPDINWTVYFDFLVQSSPDLEDYFDHDGNASVLISEPNYLKTLLTYIKEQYANDDSIVQNYLLWRFIFARLSFMSDDINQMYVNFQLLKDDLSKTQSQEMKCVDELANLLGYTVGRIYVDFWNQKGWRQDALETMQNITNAFNMTIPELDWMDPVSKEAAKSKLNHLVLNIGFPDWILNNTELDEYYKKYSVDDQANYFDLFNQLNHFAFMNEMEQILEPVNRKDFQRTPTTINAWYTDSLNSLTIPAAILNEPLFNPEYPSSVKYGAMGMIMGHELTHGFDDKGIQFNGTGYLDLWMTQYARDSYETNVVDCIINQYDHYCHYDGEFCNSGNRTQSDNIADNGGIRQAFKAYRSYVKAKADFEMHEEELLPGLEWHTQDQLFFLGFAQFWCGYMSEEASVRQLLTDRHSLNDDRVIGTVSNFDEFDKAFHCKVGDPMDPKDKCYVWTNPISTTEGYTKAAEGLLKSLDPTADPCDDFFQYACGGWINRYPIPKSASTISTNSLTSDQVVILTAAAIQNVTEDEESTALLKTKKMFNFCINDTQNKDSTSMKSFQEYVVDELYSWPIITQFWTETKSGQMFEVAGKLGAIGLPTILHAYPQVDYGGPMKHNAPEYYALFIDQASLLLGSREIYLNKTFDGVIKEYKDAVILTAVEMARSMNKVVPIESIIAEAEDIIQFETSLARISLSEAQQNNYSRMYNVFTLAQLEKEYSNIDWDAYLEALLPKDVYAIINTSQLVVSEKSYVKALNQFLSYTSQRTVQNYLIWRYTIDQSATIGGTFRSILLDLKRKTDFVEDLVDVVPSCTNDVIMLLPYASGRLYTVETFKDQIKEIVEHAAEIISYVLGHFAVRLRRLSWLDQESRQVAYKKILLLQKNIAFPDWTFNNTVLDDLYDLTIDTSKDYYTTKREVSAWFYKAQFLTLTGVEVHRKNFQSSPATQNAWYQPWLNSITIPAGELQAPFFLNDYPSAVNFGGIGAIVGHELTHGFDDDGVQFGPQGQLDYWIDESSAAGFHNITQCVINQYSQYCYTDLPTGKMCINGQVTQGENIADDGGTKTAYNAYKEWVDDHGYEPLLPGMEKFTMDQIFFLNFARSWCGAIRPEALEKQLLLDVHSPARDRVIGTLSDMKEFQNAFKCKAGDKMVPADRCDVW